MLVDILASCAFEFIIFSSQRRLTFSSVTKSSHHLGRFLRNNLLLSSRQRVMPNCFFVLARFFLRVDGVLLRCYDTRYFHDFETDVVVRERLRREADYASLERRVSSHVLRDPEQIVNFIPEVDKVVDNVKLKNISGCKDSTDDSCP